MVWNKGEKAAFVISNVALALVWLLYLVRLITRWGFLATKIRYGVCALLIFFGFLWLTLIREKKSVISLLMAGAVLVIAYEIARPLM